ncbi:MAG: LPS assembly protein LptD [Alphaproteobacteria bacterium]|nr:LPS assembly protein LptD [Alphaproteobacteria bacterium]MDD9919103.1 LPS assembly protein LptD [Alphaproteobacteria bacterium]
MKRWFFSPLFFAFPAFLAHAQVGDLPYSLQATEISFDDSTQTLVASGDVEITNGSQVIKANKVQYKQKTEEISAIGNVIYQDGNGQALTLDELVLSGDLKKATLNELRLRTEGLGEVLQASSGQLDNNIYSLSDATYSPCKDCTNGRKPWQIRAKKISFNQAENEMTYNHAVLNAYGIPVLYLPYFRHPVRGNEPKNGLLPPRFGNSTNLGTEVNLGYYYHIPDDHTDYTFRTRFMSSRGLMGQIESRREQIAYDYDMRTSFIRDDRRDTWRGHADLEFEYLLKAGRRAGFNSEVSSDDTYLNDFFNSTENYLPTSFYAEDTSQDHYFGINTTWYQDLETSRDPANTAHILPRIEFERVWNTDDTGGQAIFSADALALHRSTGTRYQRFITAGEYIKPWMLPAGNRVTFSAMLRSDLYNVNGPADDGTTVRGLAETSLLWERPMRSPSGNHLITPMAMLVLAPKGGNPEDIPNEDSVAYELEMNNLFSTNRFAGLDRVENGLRFIYGLDNRWGAAHHTQWRLFLGQSWRRDDDDALPVSGGTATKLSDWVGLLQANPNEKLNLSSSFRLDNADWNARRLDTSLRIGELEKTHLQATHTLIDQGPEELKLELEMPLSERWHLAAETQRDIADGGRQLYGEVSLAYTYDCYRITMLTRRRGFTTADVKPSTDYIINLQLLSLGHE